MTLQIVDWKDRKTWDEFVLRAKDGTIAHLFGWREVIEKSYGIQSMMLAVVDNGRMRGVLPVGLVRGLIVEKQLVSMPFLDYGGACADGSPGVAEALIKEAMQLSHQHKSRILIRSLDRFSGDLSCSLHKVTMWLPLAKTEEEMLRQLPSDRRNRLKKGLRHGLSSTLHGVDGVDEFYHVWSINMRDLGSPPHSREFFRSILETLGDAARILIVHDKGEPIAGAILLQFRGVLSIPWVSSLRAHFNKSPNQVLYWEAMRFAIASRCTHLDFGRSTKGSGTYEAKRQWGAEPRQMYLCSNREESGSFKDEMGRYRWATTIWKYIPVPLANMIGPSLRCRIPD